MESAVIDREKQLEAAQIEVEQNPQPEQSASQWVIQRPKRKTVTEEEALKWTESFAAKRKEAFIAAIRKSNGIDGRK